MGIFFNRKKKSQELNTAIVEHANVNFVNQTEEQNMVDVIRREQDDMINPFVMEDKNVSVAKRYGTKYQNALSKGQIASSKVVDVRSYVKKEEEEEKEKSQFEKDFDALDFEDDEPISKPKMSFFDELMKSIDDDVDELNDEDEEKQESPVEKIKEKPAVEKTVKKPAKKKRKSVDIDIISGDFGGVDIL